MKLVAACAFGLEAIVKRELIALGYGDARVEQPGRIVFSGDESAICRCNLWLRTADRILVEVLQFEAPDFDALFDTAKQFDWSQHIPPVGSFPVVAKTRNSQLTSLPAIQRSVKKAVVESMKLAHSVEQLDESGPTYRIEVALLDDVATITIDTTGASLHKRGYRKLSAEAPIKETLAAAMIELSVWKPARLLVDPFCGSGTIPIEAAMIGLNMAPGWKRAAEGDFAASQWPTISATIWDEAKIEANDLFQRDLKLQIIGTDRDEEVLSIARYHAEQAGVANQIHFQQRAFDELRSKREFGCIVTNPPYGERLEEQQRWLGLYQSIPAVMQRLPTWSLFLITSMPQFEQLVQKKATRRRKLYNGRIECTYYQFLGPRPPRTESPRPNESISDLSEPATGINAEIDSSLSGAGKIETAKTESAKSKKPDVAPIFGGLQPKDHEQAELFKSRLAKRARHLRRWPKRGITCYRLYEKDIPEIPLVVDRYEDFLQITEYERPHERDLARHAAWLELMKKTAAATLDIGIQRVVLKSKIKDPEFGQYKKFDQTGRRKTVHEGDLKFLVNLTDYVDTGLFLDHRITRQMVRDEAADKDFLNLFAYTGAFSVYAAAGGARSTTTVDLSKNYLDWARANLSANGFEGDIHQFIAADAMEFLRSAARDLPECFDLAVVDPPTYSNSKRTEEDWDVQKSHVELLNLLRPVMRAGGVVYFSTNFRRFKLDEASIRGFEIREISKQTVPEDFRNKRIHRCWRMVAI